MSLDYESAWTVREATEGELQRDYSRKPKAILIVDCAYQALEARRERKAKQEAEHKNAKLREQVSLLQSKLIILGQANGKLTEAITLMRDGMMR